MIPVECEGPPRPEYPLAVAGRRTQVPRWEVRSLTISFVYLEAAITPIVNIGLDLAKSFFAVDRVDATGRAGKFPGYFSAQRRVTHPRPGSPQESNDVRQPVKQRNRSRRKPEWRTNTVPPRCKAAQKQRKWLRDPAATNWH